MAAATCPWSRNKVDNEIGRMPVDSIYSLVLKVTYKVEATRRAAPTSTSLSSTSRDQAVDPPRDAIASAGRPWSSCSAWPGSSTSRPSGIDIGPSPVDEPSRADLALRSRTLQPDGLFWQLPRREGIHTVGEPISRWLQDLLDIRNFGAKSIDEVKAKLVEMGLSLKDSAPGFDLHAALAAYGDDDDDAFVEDEQYCIRNRTATCARVYPSTWTRLERWDRTCPSPPGSPLGGKPCPPAPDPVRNLATRLFGHGRITTTEARAALRPVAERS